MTLITPNFADKVKSEGTIQPQGNGAAAPVHIVAPHEPTTVNPVWSAATMSLPAVSFEQKMNVAPVVEPAPLKIALIGTAPSSRMLAPFNDPSWKIWGCSPGNQGILPRVDAWFELHANLLWPECKSYGEPYIAWLNQQKFPIFMQDKSLVPNANVFPKDELVKEFGPYFFTSSFTWMMAYAMTIGAKEIALFGIDMASHDEYIIQRPGAYYFFVEAARRGIKIWAPFESDIMQAPGLYAYSDVSQLGRKTLARRIELQQRIAGHKQQLAQIDQHRAQVAADLRYLEGALEDTTYYIEIHLGAQDNAGTGYLDQLLAKARSPESQG